MRLAFGGPDLPSRVLRDLLLAQIDSSPAGARIDWATYYFRDRELAEALTRASDRGVRVSLTLEGRPRQRRANDGVIGILEAHGLAGRLRVRTGGAGSLHAKIYAFSEPRTAWVGSYNPSGDDRGDPLLAEIGDQNRGHNLLVGITDAVLIDALVAHVNRLGGARSVFDRLRPAFNRVVESNGARLFFYPRVRTRVVERDIDRLRPGDRLVGAVSHLKRGSLSSALAAASGRGAKVRLLVHDTERRVPGALVDRLRRAGVRVDRAGDGHRAPMHAKFLALESGGRTVAWTGSYNYNARSRWLNDELLLRTEDASVWEALRTRFEEIASVPHG